ncbi:MAG: hypothetical protein WCY43_03445 [Patescibacteria group bacterium]|nr:hypothetical protein [Patescibacteria group bacterium]
MSLFVKIYDRSSYFLNNLKSLLNNFYRPLQTKAFFSFFIILNIFLWSFSYYIYNNVTQDRLILHYNIDIGIDSIGDKHDVFLIPFVSLFLIFINTIFLLFFFKKKIFDFRFIFYFNSIFLLITQIFLFLSILTIYLINFR